VQGFVLGEILELDRDGGVGALFDIDLPSGEPGDFFQQRGDVPRLDVSIHLSLFDAPIQGIRGVGGGCGQDQRQAGQRGPRIEKPSHAA